MDSLNTDTASDDDKDLQAPVTKMPYGFKKTTETSPNNNTFDPLEINV